MRTTLDIDTPVLEELKRLQKRQEAGKKKSLGKLVSELLIEALGRRDGKIGEGVGLEWTSKPMNALVDLEDKDALYAELDRKQ